MKKDNERFSKVVAQLEHRGIMPDRAPSLLAIEEALRKTGALSKIDPNKVIVVAGTNGKGSTCATLEALLLSASQKVGLYTSPHLVQTNERIRIHGKDIDETRFCDLHDRLLPVAEHLSHFEALTLMAVEAFLEQDLDWFIFEVGLGGTWDATNAIPHKHCIIAPIDRDHEKLLGNTLVEIAKNKFGIVHGGCNVVCYPLPEELKSLQQEVKSKTSSQWTFAPSPTWTVESGRKPQFSIHWKTQSAPINLPGKRGAENTTLALTAFEALGFSGTAHLHALQNVRWPGRMEEIQVPGAPCPIYVSGDHNPHGVKSLLELLPNFSRKHCHFLVGIGQEKAADEMLPALLAQKDASLYLTHPPFKGRSRQDYANYLSQSKGYWDEPKAALEHIIKNANESDLIVITGSLYLVGAIKAALLL